MTHDSPILRVVRMAFRPEACEAFDALFRANKARIAAVPGCCCVTCLPDVEGGGGRTTLSVWRSLRDLEAYRASELFKAVWSETKPGFAAPPVAWSMPVDGAFIAAAEAYLGAPNDSPCWP